MPSPPALEHVFDVAVRVAVPLAIGETGAGLRRVVDILGGDVTGPRLQGRIRSGGADFQLIRATGLTELHARYVIEAADGAPIYVENSGIRFGPPDALAKLNRGEPVDPALIYFRTVPRFETEVPAYRWLMEHIFIGVASAAPIRSSSKSIWCGSASILGARLANFLKV
ncbi:MAG: DUF3237 domain-containing protein [Pseudomonadota bacterium]